MLRERAAAGITVLVATTFIAPRIWLIEQLTRELVAALDADLRIVRRRGGLFVHLISEDAQSNLPCRHNSIRYRDVSSPKLWVGLSAADCMPCSNALPYCNATLSKSCAPRRAPMRANELRHVVPLHDAPWLLARIAP